MYWASDTPPPIFAIQSSDISAVPGSPTRRMSAPPVLASTPKMHNTHRSVSTLPLRTDSLGELPLPLPVPTAASTPADARINVLVTKIDGLWREACALTEGNVKADVNTYHDNLRTMEPRVRRDLDTMRALLAATGNVTRSNVYKLFSSQPQLAAAAGEALTISAELCDAMKPYCPPQVWRLFDGLRNDLEKLVQGSGFGSSLADLDSLFGPGHTLADEPHTLSFKGMAQQDDAVEEDELDRLIREYEQHTSSTNPRTNPADPDRYATSALQPSAQQQSSAQAVVPASSLPQPAFLKLAPGTEKQVQDIMAAPMAAVTATATATATKIVPPAQAQGSAQLAAPMTSPPATPQRRKLERNAGRTRAQSSPALVSPERAEARSPSVATTPRLARWHALLRRDAGSGSASTTTTTTTTAQQSPRKSQASDSLAGPTFRTPKMTPSKAAATPREVLGFAAAQMQWFLGTPSEFQELYEDNSNVLKFLNSSTFQDKPWRAEMLETTLLIRGRIRKINELFLINSKLALEETKHARALTMSLEGRFSSLCSQKLESREQVVLFFARNLSWNCHKILGRAFQSLLVREKMNPRAVSAAAVPNENSLAEKMSTSGLASVTTTTSVPSLPLRQTMVATRFTATIPKQSPRTMRVNVSAPNSPRQPREQGEQNAQVLQSASGTAVATSKPVSQAELRRRQWSDAPAAHASMTQLPDSVSRARTRALSEPLSPVARHGSAKTAQSFPNARQQQEAGNPDATPVELRGTHS